MKALLSLMIMLCLATAVVAAPHPFQVEDMQKLSRVGGAQLSPDSKWVAFTVARSDVAKNKSVTNLWMVSADGGTPQQLTFATAGSNAGPAWSPDSKYLYFIS